MSGVMAKAAVAQIHATLALVKQQRTRNLLTVLTAGGSFLDGQDVSKAPAR